MSQIAFFTPLMSHTGVARHGVTLGARRSDVTNSCELWLFPNELAKVKICDIGTCVGRMSQRQRCDIERASLRDAFVSQGQSLEEK